MKVNHEWRKNAATEDPVNLDLDVGQAVRHEQQGVLTSEAPRGADNQPGGRGSLADSAEFAVDRGQCLPPRQPERQEDKVKVNGQARDRRQEQVDRGPTLQGEGVSGEHRRHESKEQLHGLLIVGAQHGGSTSLEPSSMVPIHRDVPPVGNA